MHILIFGASGGVGQSLVAQALAYGDTVTAAVRTPEKLTIEHENLTKIKCDAFEAKEVATLFAQGQHYDAVASCLNTNCGIKPGHDLTQMMTNIVPLLQQYQLQRVVYCASAGVEHELTGERGLVAMQFLQHPLADHRAAIDLLQTAKLAVTIVRPTGLTHEAVTGHYLEALTGVPAHGSGRIGRADVAHFMLKALHDDDYIGQSVALSN